MDSLVQDLSYALRSLRRAPGFTSAVVATLAIGIGALTAVFCIVHSVLFKPLPFREPEQLVQIWTGSTEHPHGPTASANFVDLRDHNRSFNAVSAEDFAWFNLAGDDQRPERLYGASVSASFFAVMGVQPALGRAFSNDEAESQARVVVIGNGIWQERYAGDTRVIGRTVSMNGESYSIIGVMPPAFDFPTAVIGDHVELWVPIAWRGDDLSRGIRRLGITARLAPGVSLEQARGDMSVLSSGLSAEFPRELKAMAFSLVPLREELVGSSRRLLLVLFGAVGMILLIACANVSNLALARAQTRERELTVRAALGAGRARILRQLLTENLVLAVAGGLLGLVAAVWLTAAIVAAAPAGLPRVEDIGVDARVFMFALAASVGASLLFGLAPAFEVGRNRLGEALSGSGRSSTDSRRRSRARSVVVTLEISLSVVLLVGAGLLLRSLERLVAVNPGFDPRSVVIVTANLPSRRFSTDAQQWQFVQSAIEKIGIIPGAQTVGAVDRLPFARSDALLGISMDGQPSASLPGDGISAHARSATRRYFAAMRIPLLHGRAFLDADRAGSPQVAIINEAMARKYWPNIDPAGVIGHRVAIGTKPMPDEWHTIVGVVGNVKYRSLGDAAEPELYYSLAQSPSARVFLVARAERDGATLSTSVRQALLQLDKEQPVNIRLLTDLVDGSIAQTRFRGMLVGGFAAIALVLAIVGVYGVVSFGVSRRTREIGVRVALGAHSREIVALILRDGAALTFTGLAIGFAASTFLTKTIKTMLFEVETTDAVTLVGVGVLLAVAATVANYLPARRAAKVDPMIAMRAE